MTNLVQDHQVDGDPVLLLLAIKLSHVLVNLSASKLKNFYDKNGADFPPSRTPPTGVLFERLTTPQ